MITKTLSFGPSLSFCLEFHDFTLRDFLSIKIATREQASRELGRITSHWVKEILKEKLSAPNALDQLLKTQGMLAVAIKLQLRGFFTLNNTNYLERYLAGLTAYCEGAGITLNEGVFLQSFADSACQTILVEDTKLHACNIIHIEENPDDIQLVDLNKTLDLDRARLSHDKLLQTYDQLIQTHYRYQIVHIETENESQLFFGYPGLCGGGPAFGINLAHSTVFAADTLTPNAENMTGDIWSNAIVSMLYDCGTISTMKILMSRLIESKLAVLGGYAIHAVQWVPELSMASYEFASHRAGEQSMITNDTRRLIGQTNYPQTPALQSIDRYQAPPKNSEDVQVSHIIKRRTQQLCATAQTKIFPSADHQHDIDNLLTIIASPEGDVETLDHGPAFAGFPTLYQNSYMVGSLSSNSGKIVIGKLTPPPIQHNEYALVFDPSNPKHLQSRLADLKTLKSVAIVYSAPTKRVLKTSFAAADTDTFFVAAKVREALKNHNIQSSLIEIREDTIGLINTIRADIIFNLIEWTGEDIPLVQQAFAHFRTLGIPVTGSTEQNYLETANKITMKQALEKAHIQTPVWQTFTTSEEQSVVKFSYPVIVKPAYEHCSIGLGYNSIAENKEQLIKIVKRQIEKFHQPVLAEEFIQGRELLVYLLEEKSFIRILPIEEILFTNNRKFAFQTYESKWDSQHKDYKTSHVTIAKLSKKQQEVIEQISREAFQKLGFRGYARFDIRFRDEIPYLLETNCNPNVYDSDEDQIPGIAFPDYIYAIVQSAFYHFEHGWKI